MASLFVFGGMLAYEKYKDRKTRKQASKERFAQLKIENADRIAALREKTCFCNTSDWTGQGCAVHGPEAQRQTHGQGQMEEKRSSEEFERARRANTTSTLPPVEPAPAYSNPIINNDTNMEITTSIDNASAHSAPVIDANAMIESARTSEASTRNEESTMIPSEERATRTRKSRNEPGRRRRNRRGSGSEDDEEELIIPDVSHVVPPR
ncbi:MAG: hypothetical protein Q9181_005546, partial [Wetmoreana brouardii]